ncbi:ribose 5-phosphate isomerase B [Metamycoplasma sualvi]|uniref:ribose 5-phosphate isomerase B n=1 Tax=Metamycoplasma sualvi TaxID=2125 RepID=UPI003873CCA1
MKEKIYLSSDHAGYDLKDKIKKYLEDQKYEVIDLGTNNNYDSVSYSEYGKKLAKNVLNDKGSYGIGVCGTGLGISYSVNRFKGIRGARVTSVEDAKLAREHNDANVLLFGGRQLNIDQVEKMIDQFFKSKYEGGRHQKRIDELDE